MCYHGCMPSLPSSPSRFRRPVRTISSPVPTEAEILDQLVRSLEALRRANAALRALSRPVSSRASL